MTTRIERSLVKQGKAMELYLEMRNTQDIKSELYRRPLTCGRAWKWSSYSSRSIKKLRSSDPWVNLQTNHLHSWEKILFIWSRDFGHGVERMTSLFYCLHCFAFVFTLDCWDDGIRMWSVLHFHSCFFSSPGSLLWLGAIEDIVTLFECDCLIEFPSRAKTINTKILDEFEQKTREIDSLKQRLKQQKHWLVYSKSFWFIINICSG